jgi:casein kinase II subunit beta
MSWLETFLAQPRNALLVQVDDEFLHNSFNITGAKQQLPHFTPAYELLRRGILSPGFQSERETIEKEAEALYCLLHHRFLLTRAGMQLLYEKFQHSQFETCPRVNCRGAQCLPYGLSEQYGRSPVKWYCPGCGDVYDVSERELESLDGSAFGPSWVHLFLQKFPEVIPSEPVKVYVPKIFGFRMAHAEIPDESDEMSGE